MTKLLLAFAFACSVHAQLTVVQSALGDVGTVVSGTTPTYKDHPDPDIAIGPVYGVELTGQNFRVFALSDPATPVQNTNTNTFFVNGGAAGYTRCTDPRVAYNTFVNRWIVACTDNATKLDWMCVSATSDPRGTDTTAWKCIQTANANFGDDTYKIGYDINGTYLTVMAAGAATYNVYAINNFNLQWSGAGSPILPTVFNVEYEIYPETDINPAKALTDPAILVVRSGGQTQNLATSLFSLSFRKISWTGADRTASNFTPAMSAVTTIATGQYYTTPINAMAQLTPGTTTFGGGTETHRVFSAYRSGGYLWEADASGPCSSSGLCPGQPVNGFNGFFWHKIDPITLAIVDKGSVMDSTTHYIFPALVADANGVIHFFVQATNSSMFMSLMEFWHLPTDAPGATLHGPAMLKQGTANYTTGCASHNPSNTGTYANAVADPSNPNLMWFSNQFGGSATVCQWTTQILATSYSLGLFPLPSPLLHEFAFLEWPELRDWHSKTFGNVLLARHGGID